MFPPTFLYTQSWEDPDPDMEVRRERGAGATVLRVTAHLARGVLGHGRAASRRAEQPERPGQSAGSESEGWGRAGARAEFAQAYLFLFLFP